MGFVVLGLFLVLGGLWCGLFGGLCGGCLLYVDVLCGVFLYGGWGGCWLFVGLPRFLRQFSSAPRGPPWRCLQWVLDVWFVWFSHNSTGHVLVFNLPFHIVCTLGLGICFCIGLDIQHSGSGFKSGAYFISCDGFHIFQLISQVLLVFSVKYQF